MDNIQVNHDIIHHVFFLRTPSGIARLDYSKPKRDIIEFERTYVPENYRERGIGTALADRAVSYARERDLKIVATCPFVKSFIKEHHRA